MKLYFADTFFYLALLNTRDAYHKVVSGFPLDAGSRIVTSHLVLIELADSLASTRGRAAFMPLYRTLRADRIVRIAQVTQPLVAASMRMYADRPDKRWSLTDCSSFVLMRRAGITQALTGDRHFEQAGFEVLFK